MIQNKDGARFEWLLSQSGPMRDTVLCPPIPPEDLEYPEKWPDIIRARIDLEMENKGE